MKKLLLTILFTLVLCAGASADCVNQLEVKLKKNKSLQKPDEITFLNTSNKKIIIWDVELFDEKNNSMIELNFGMSLDSYQRKSETMDFNDDYFAHDLIKYYIFRCFYHPTDKEIKAAKEKGLNPEIKVENMKKFRINRT